MVDVTLGDKLQKLPKNKGFFKIKSGSNEYKYVFVRECKIIYDDSNVQVDNPGIVPIFTRLTDEVGTFEFTLGNTFDIYGTDNDVTKVWLYTNWQEGIRKTEFIEVEFIRESPYPKAATGASVKKRVLLTSKFRIKSCGDEYSQSEAIDDIVVSGAVLDDDIAKAIQVV